MASRLTRRSRSRLTRRASASAFLSSQAHTEGKAGIAHSTSMKSRPSSFAPVHGPPSFNRTLNGALYSDSDASEDETVVKKESRSPSPSFLSTSPPARRASLLQERGPIARDSCVCLPSTLPDFTFARTLVSTSIIGGSLWFFDHHSIHDRIPFSLWDYLREELLATDFDSHQELKWERVRQFPKCSYRAGEGEFLIVFIFAST